MTTDLTGAPTKRYVVFAGPGVPSAIYDNVKQAYVADGRLWREAIDYCNNLNALADTFSKLPA
jgi:hypothetical protein